MRKFLFLAIVVTLVLAACGTPAATQPPAATEPPAATQPPAAESGSFQIPEVQEGKFNVAMVLIGPHDDGGWSQAHFEGLEYIQQNVENTHTAYIENVPEGADSEQVFRSLARKGFDLIFGHPFDHQPVAVHCHSVVERNPYIMLTHT